MNLRLRRGTLFIQKLESPKYIKAPGGVTNFHLSTPKTFWYEAHCVLHEPDLFDEDLTGCLLIVEPLGGIEFRLGDKQVHLIYEQGVLAVIEGEAQ